MSLTIEPTNIPLQPDEDGNFRVGGTRVTLDSVVYAYLQGETPEEIARHYPTVALKDIYFVLGFYLTHRQQVDDYLKRRRAQAEEMRREHERHVDATGLRERLLTRQAASQRRGR